MHAQPGGIVDKARDRSGFGDLRAHLHVLPLILQLRRHTFDLVAGDERMGSENLGQNRGAAAMESHDENSTS